VLGLPCTLEENTTWLTISFNASLQTYHLNGRCDGHLGNLRRDHASDRFASIWKDGRNTVPDPGNLAQQAQ
jgi:hypothetical protein